MKIKKLIKFVFLISIFINSYLNAETVFFDSKNIKIEENGNMIFATKGKARIPSSNLVIEGDKFIYNKKNSELIIIDDVKYFDSKNNIKIKSEKIIYNENENSVFSKSETFIKIKEIYNIDSSDILFDRNLNKIISNQITNLTDTQNNKFLFNKGLIFELIPEIITYK